MSAAGRLQRTVHLSDLKHLKNRTFKRCDDVSQPPNQDNDEDAIPSPINDGREAIIRSFQRLVLCCSLITLDEQRNALHLLRYARFILSKPENLEIVNSIPGVVDALVRLADVSEPDIMQEALCCILNYTYVIGYSKRFIHAGIAPVLEKRLTESFQMDANVNPIVQATVLCVANILGEPDSSVGHEFFSSRMLALLASLLEHNSKLNSRSISLVFFCLGNMAKKASMDAHIRSLLGFLPSVRNICTMFVNSTIMSEALWFLSLMTENHASDTNVCCAVLDAEFFDILRNNAVNQQTALSIPAVSVLSNMVFDDCAAERLLNQPAGIVSLTLKLATSRSSVIIEKAYLMLSNLAVSPTGSTALLQRDVRMYILSGLTQYNAKVAYHSVMLWGNMLESGANQLCDPQMIQELMHYMDKWPRAKNVHLGLQLIEKILEESSRIQTTSYSDVRACFLENGLLATMERLQTHPDNDVHDAALEISQCLLNE